MTNIKHALSSVLPRGSSREPANNLIVRLGQGCQEPVTRVEQLAVSMLTSRGVMPLRNLVESVASELYREELRRGAQILDIGLFGSKLFEADVVREIEAGNGTLWRIEDLKDVNVQ